MIEIFKLKYTTLRFTPNLPHFFPTDNCELWAYNTVFPILGCGFLYQTYATAVDSTRSKWLDSCERGLEFRLPQSPA